MEQQNIRIMKKTVIGALVALTLNSCTKEESYVRNYSYPIDIDDPTGCTAGGNVLVHEGETDEEVMRRVRNFDYLKGKTILFLSPDTYNNSGEGYSVENPDPRYMKFPHSINSMGGDWGWDRLYEYEELGEEEFCNKYFNGERTLGMKLD